MLKIKSYIQTTEKDPIDSVVDIFFWIIVSPTNLNFFEFQWLFSHSIALISSFIILHSFSQRRTLRVSYSQKWYVHAYVMSQRNIRMHPDTMLQVGWSPYDDETHYSTKWGFLRWPDFCQHVGTYNSKRNLWVYAANIFNCIMSFIYYYFLILIL